MKSSWSIEQAVLVESETSPYTAEHTTLTVWNVYSWLSDVTLSVANASQKQCISTHMHDTRNVLISHCQYTNYLAENDQERNNPALQTSRPNSTRLTTLFADLEWMKIYKRRWPISTQSNVCSQRQVPPQAKNTITSAQYNPSKLTQKNPDQNYSHT